VNKNSKESVALAKGLKIFDVALPQQWLNSITAQARDRLRTMQPTTDDDRDAIYWAILSGTVWSYDNSLLGQPFPLTDKAKYYLTLARTV